MPGRAGRTGTALGESAQGNFPPLGDGRPAGSVETLSHQVEIAEALVGPVPVIQAVVGGVPFVCLWDTKSNVSVLTESFF